MFYETDDISLDDVWKEVKKEGKTIDDAVAL